MNIEKGRFDGGKSERDDDVVGRQHCWWEKCESLEKSKNLNVKDVKMINCKNDDVRLGSGRGRVGWGNQGGVYCQ